MNWAIEPLPRNGPLFEGAIAVYGDAFAEPPYSDPDRGKEIRTRLLEVHGLRKGFRSFAAVSDKAEIIGMIYGYHGGPGQWWHDTVLKKLPFEAGRSWLSNCYEVVEVAVAPHWQGKGVGRALIRTLLEGRDEDTCVLSTRTDSRAHELYERLGFEEIATVSFATTGPPFYIMGKRLR